MHITQTEIILKARKMELLRLSKFKLQLRGLITEVRELRVREQTTAEQLHLSVQKQKKTEEEHSRKLQELQIELASSHELQQKLERKVEYLQNDNLLLENKQKELKATIDCLVQSRDSFFSIYEDSTCEMKRSMEIKDRQLSFLSEKIHAHMSLFESIEKEAISVKQVVDNVQQIVNEKENVVAGLKRKLDQVSAFEKDFVEKIWSLENTLRCTKEEIRRKDTVISELEGKLEAAKISNNCQPQIEELQRSLSVKEDSIRNLTTEKQALRFEVRGLEIILRKIEEAVMNMNAEDQRVFSSVLKGQEECPMMSENENNRSIDVAQECREESPCRDSGQGAAENTGSPLCQEYISAKNPSQEKNNLNSCISEQFVCSPRRSAYSDPQSATNAPNTSPNGDKGSCSQLGQHPLDSESSTAEAEALENSAIVL